MREPTRRLLLTIADEGVDALLDELRAGSRSEAELRAAVRLSHRAAHERLARLQELGLVEPALRAPTGRGRPAREWQLTHAELVGSFAEQADAFARRVGERDAAA